MVRESGGREGVREEGVNIWRASWRCLGGRWSVGRPGVRRAWRCGVRWRSIVRELHASRARPPPAFPAHLPRSPAAADTRVIYTGIAQHRCNPPSLAGHAGHRLYSYRLLLAVTPAQKQREAMHAKQAKAQNVGSEEAHKSDLHPRSGRLSWQPQPCLGSGAKSAQAYLGRSSMLGRLAARSSTGPGCISTVAFKQPCRPRRGCVSSWSQERSETKQSFAVRSIP